MVPDRQQMDRLWLVAEVTTTSPRTWLYLDASNPQTLLASQTIQPPKSVTAAILVVDGSTADVKPLKSGNIRISRAVLWSLLHPSQAGSLSQLDADDRISAERQLRAEGRHLWQRLRWWAALSTTLRTICRDLLVAHCPSLNPMFDMLANMAARAQSDPFSGWSDREEHQRLRTESSFPQNSRAEEPDAPTSTSRSVPDEPDALAAWVLDAEGLGRLFKRHFQPREEQAQMTEAISRALSEEESLLIEAGTGVGKTLAYLVPLLQAVQAKESRAVVSTHTRALQVQILTHDLPLLAGLYPGLKTRLLMGRRNYLCRRKLLEFLESTIENRADAWSSVAFRLWLAETSEGMREELANHPILASHLITIFDTSEPCASAICYEGKECFVQRARRLAREADLLVVNHALLMHDLLADHSLMGNYDYLIVDEAHRLPEVALESHSVRCDRLRLHVVEELLGSATSHGDRPRLLHDLAKQLAFLGAPGIAMTTALDDLGASIQHCLRSYQQWWTTVERCFEARLEPEQRPRGRVRVYNQAEAFGPIRSETQALLETAASASASYANVSQHAERLPDLPAGTEENLATLAQIGLLLDQLQLDIRFLTEGSEEDWVVWLELGQKSGVRILGATMLESSNLLRDYWFGSGLRPIMTSATLAVGEDFSHMMTELGLSRWQPPTRFSLVESPFVYDRQVLILAPVDFPPPDQPEFGTAVTEVLRTIQHQIPRKTMALFTSYHLLRQVAAALSDVMPVRDDGSEELQFNPAISESTLLLHQSPGGATSSLVKQFREASCALLLGTMTFWEGVDFPGSDLEILVVTKLPFLVPNDPWVEARCGRIQAVGEDPFATFMVRDAVLRLRQGLGRLIRRSDDRGVIVLLDSRLHSRNYGSTFLNALPTSPRYFHDNEELVERMTNFFASATDQATG